jgi:hypothetical protein
MKGLEILSELVNWVFLIYLFIRVLNTMCFSGFDWVMTLIILIFSYFIRYISKIEEGE